MPARGKLEGLLSSSSAFFIEFSSLRVMNAFKS